MAVINVYMGAFMLFFMMLLAPSLANNAQFTATASIGANTVPAGTGTIQITLTDRATTTLGPVPLPAANTATTLVSPSGLSCIRIKYQVTVTVTITGTGTVTINSIVIIRSGCSRSPPCNIPTTNITAPGSRVLAVCNFD